MIVYMVRTGRPKAELVLSDVEREQLTRWARRRKSAQALALRCQIVLACADGGSNKGVAAELGVAEATVGKWRRRFITHRLDGLLDEPRPGAPRQISDAQVEAVMTATLEEMPQAATHWSTRSMAAKAGISRQTVHRIWQAFNVAPHRSESFKLSTDPQFIDKVRDVVGIYLNPPENAIVLCVDEKAQIQALNRSQPVLPMMPGLPERQTHDYVRHGTTTLFAALDIATGKVISALHQRHRAIEFRKFLVRIDKQVPAELDVHVICDNYGTHKTAAIRKWLAAHPRFHMHFIPTGSSWLNLVERWFGELTTKLLQRGVHLSVADLQQDLRTWITGWNEDPRPYVWTKTADDIFTSLARYMQRISGTGH